jgi:hypothetical protein
MSHNSYIQCHAYPTQTLNPTSLSTLPLPSCLIIGQSTPLALVTPYHSPLRPVSSPELVTGSWARMIHAVSSPSNLGTRGSVSIGTPVDPWMVRPIKGTLGQVALRLGKSVLREFELRPQKTQRPKRTLPYRLSSVRIEESGNHATAYAPCRRR